MGFKPSGQPINHTRRICTTDAVVRNKRPKTGGGPKKKENARRTETGRRGNGATQVTQGRLQRTRRTGDDDGETQGCCAGVRGAGKRNRRGARVHDTARTVLLCRSGPWTPDTVGRWYLYTTLPWTPCRTGTCWATGPHSATVNAAGKGKRWGQG